MTESIYEFTDPEIERKVSDPLSVLIEGFEPDNLGNEDMYKMICTAENDFKARTLRNDIIKSLKAKMASRGKPKKEQEKMETEFNQFLSDYKKAHPELSPVSTHEPEIKCCEYEGIEAKYGIDPAAITCAGYHLTMSGVGTTANIKGIEIPVCVCSDPIMISKRSIDVSDKETPEEALDVAWFMDGEWKTLRKIPREKLASKTSLVKLLAARGIDVTEKSAENLMTFLTAFDKQNRAIIPRVQMTRVIGWTDNGTFAPITGDVEMASFGKSDYNDIASAIGAHGDPEIWYDGVKKLRAESWSVGARIAMAASFASPMIQKLNFSPSWLHLEGKTGSAKTVTLRLAASIYAHTTSTGGYMRSMDNTDTGLELLAGFVHNMPLCLNEMQRIKDPKTLPKKVYMITEGSGRGRANIDVNLRDSAKFCTFPISTGEKPIVTDQDEGGANNRVVAIRVKDGDTLVKDAPKFCQDVLDKSWGHAALPWIEGIKDLDYDALKTEILGIVERLKARGKAEKQAIAAGIMLVADRLAEEIIFHDGVRLTEDDIFPYLKDDTFVDDRLRAYDVMCSMISENSNSFVAGSYTPNGRIWGKMQNGGDTVIFDSTIFSDEMRKRGFDPSMYVDWAIEKGVIEDGRKYGDHRHLARRLRIDPRAKGGTLCYVIDMTATPTGMVVDEGVTPPGFTKADDPDNPYTQPEAIQQKMEV